MKNKKTKAFAACAIEPAGDIYLQTGMDLRDWFAGNALNAILSNDPAFQGFYKRAGNDPDRVGVHLSETVYNWADDMMKAREK